MSVKVSGILALQSHRSAPAPARGTFRCSKVYDVQGFCKTGVSILVHVVEHSSYHVGQITYYVKSRKGIDLKYYGGTDLTRTNIAQ
jgi:hypothetical protein